MTLQQALFDAQPTRTCNAAASSWLIDHLRAAGHLTESGLTRRARPRPCPSCGTWTVCGLDADVLALEARCDTTPLTQLGEVVALAAGRRTVELVHTRGRFELEQRWADHIAARPPAAGRYDVLAEHRCHQELGALMPGLSTTSAFAPVARTTSEEPGF